MNKFLCTLLLFILITGCKEGQLEDDGSPQTFSQESLILLDYSATTMDLFIKGSVLASGIEDYHQILFYNNSTCTGESLGQESKQKVQLEGVTLTHPLAEEIHLFYRTDTNAHCFFALDYQVPLNPVPVPILTRTIPESPARLTTDIAVLGEIFPPQATIEIYTDALCSVLAATGTATEFAQPGLIVSVPADAITPITARVRDPRGLYSDCQLLSEYEHRSELANEVEFLNTTPLSPSNSVNNPVIRGLTQSSIVSVTLYSDAACSVSLGQVDAADFDTQGLEVTLPSNSTTQIYAQGLNDFNDPTPCLFMTEYIHDDVAPAAPAFASADPVTPTRLTTFPKIIGTAPTDAAVIRLFSDNMCNQVIGFGNRVDFISTGLTANLPANSTTSIYAQSLDSSGNESACTYFLDYKHNTIPPQPPIFQTSTPTSPTNVTDDPLLIGTPSMFTWEMYFYDDIACTNLVGQGSPNDFSSTGISVDLQVNTNNFVYSRVRDLEGNYSDCTELTSYDHSNLPAPNPVFSVAYPNSPTRLTTTPSVAGTANTTVTDIELYVDSGCSTLVNSGSRGNFQAAGIPVTVAADAITPIYAVANDIYGNQSSCQLLTNYTHTTIPPLDPTFSLTSPASPNNVSFTPTIFGNAFTNLASPIDPVNVIFYDNPSCVGSLGNGDPADFPTIGIPISVAPDAPSSIYARSFDAAGNGSNCTFLTSYIHNTLTPGQPLLDTLTPGTPSYTPLTQVTGSFGPSTDFMARTSVVFYSDNTCSTEILTTTPNIFENVGIDIPLSANTVTPLSAASFNGVGNKSACSQLVDFNTYDTPPTNLTLNANLNGSIQAFWQVDSVASPSPTYHLKRSTQSGGPYTTVYSGVSNAFQDQQINEGVTYYYVIQASNSTGQSLNSAEESITIDAPAPVAAASLQAIPSHTAVTLTWSGFPQNLSYNVYRGDTSGGPYQLVISGHQNNSYTDFGLTNDQTYYYVVKGFNPEGQSTSSNEARVVPRPVPATPANIWIQPYNSLPECSGNQGIWVQWTEPSHFDGFRLHRTHSNSINWYQSVSTSQYVDCDMNGAGTLEYTLAASWGPYHSADTSPVIFELGGQTSLFVKPGDSEILLEWGAPGASDAIDIYKSSKSKGPFTLLTTQANTGSYLDTAVSNGQGYFYYVQAREGASIYQGFPSPVGAGIPGIIPSAPSNLIGTTEGNNYKLSWTAPSHYNDFTVYRSASPGGPFSSVGSSTLNSFTDYVAPNGMNYYRVTVNWGTTETSPSNTVSFRKAKVTGLVATNSSTDVQLDWTSFVGATTYRVERSPDGSNSWATLGVPATNTFTDSTAVTAESYYYRVTPLFADFTEGQPSSIASGRRTDSDVPGGLSLISQTPSSLGLKWVAVPGATNYNISVATAPGGPYTLAKTTTGASTTVTGLTARTQYYLQVEATVGGSPFLSTPFAAATLGTVTPPSVTVGDNLVDLNWSASGGVTSYDLERSTDNVSYSSLVTGLATTSYTDATAVNGQIYFYRVIHNYAGVGSSTSLPTQGVTPGVVPTPPQGLTVVNNSTGIDVTLSWIQSSEANLYGVYRATNIGGPYTQLFNISSNSNVSVSGLTPGQIYYFQITAINGSVESGPSSILSVRPMATPPAPTVSFVSSTEIQLDWDPVTNANTYDILRTTNKYNYEVIATGVVATDYLDTSADPNFNYYYAYQPVAASGEQLPQSAQSVLIGTGTVINAPQGVTISADATPDIYLDWAPVPQAATYEIHRSTTSGSGYTMIGSVLGNTTTYTDSTGVASQTYYYVIRALNDFTTPSAFSNEVNISLVSAPTGLAAVNNDVDIDLSWTAYGGATQYHVLRSLDNSSNFGPIGTTVTNSFTDSTAVPGETYYYKVVAELAGGVLTPESSSVSLLKTGVMELSFPVELLDRPVASASLGTQIFDRTTTNFDTNEYDGTITYNFEIVATNLDGVSHTVDIVDATDATIVSITVPSNTTDPTRLSQSFTPAAGSQTWRVQVEQTLADSDVEVTQARVIVNQTDASKTSIYIPLLSSDSGSSLEDILGHIAQSNSETVSLTTSSLPYIRETAALVSLAPLDPWALEVVVASEAGVIGEVALYNIDLDSIVEGSVTEFGQTTPTAVRVPLQNTHNNFDDSNESQAFGISLRCQFDCSSGNARLYKAGLWVRLVNLQKAQTTWRTSLGSIIPASNFVFDDQRSFINLNDFNNPDVYWQVSMNSNQSVNLGVAGVNDSGLAGITDIAGSTLTGGGTGFVEILRTGSLTINSGERYMLKGNTGAAVFMYGSQLIINNEL